MKKQFLATATVLVAAATSFAQDECSSATAISGTTSFSYDNTAATTGAEVPFCGTVANDLWYIWTADADGVATVTTCSTASGDSKIAAWDADACPPTTDVACNDDDCSLRSTISFPCVNGTDYYLQLGSFSAGSAGVFDVDITIAAATPGDACADAFPLAGQGVFPWDNTGFNGGAASCGSIAGDYWFEWTADATGMATVTTCTVGAGDTKIAAWDACGGTELGCNDDDCGLQSTIMFPVSSGTNYYLQLGHFSSGSQGPEMVDISIMVVPPANDECIDAEVIAGEGMFPFDNTNATTDGPGGSCGLVNLDVWFAWTAPADGVYSVDVCDAGFDTKLAVYNTFDCPAVDEVACNDDSCGLQSSVSFAAVGGGEYLIQVGAFSSGTGAGNLTIMGDPCSTAGDDGLEDNDDCSTAVGVTAGSYPGLFCWKLDEDWYTIDVLDGETLTVDAFFIHLDGDIDLRLYDACGGTQVASSLSTDDNEQVMWTNTSGGTVSTKLHVDLWDFSAEDCNNYDMEVTIEAPPIGTKYCSANANSTGSPADIDASGSASSGAGDLTLEASPVPDDTGVFFHGDTEDSVPFGNGFRCVADAIKRGQAVTASGNLATYTYDNSILKKDLSDHIGTTRKFQYWFRDPMGGGSLFNLSNAISIDILP